MRTYKYILIVAALTLGVNAQTILVTTNNVLDLNPERDAISALEGAIRIRHTITDGADVLDVSAGFPIPLTIASRVDGYTNSVINTITNDGVGVVWWVIPFLSAGEYELKSTVTLPGDSFPVFDRYLSVTSAPSAAGDIYITNNVSVGDTSVTNIFEAGAFSNSFDVTLSVTNNFNPTFAPTNTFTISGDLTQTIITNFIDNFIGVNVFTPYLADTNVSGTWTIDLKTNAPVAIYEQIGNVTQVVFSVDDTNQIALAEILLLATTNSITWPTNGLTWAAGSEPTPTASEYNRIYFEAWRDYVYAVFVGSNP